MKCVFHKRCKSNLWTPDTHCHKMLSSILPCPSDLPVSPLLLSYIHSFFCYHSKWPTKHTFSYKREQNSDRAQICIKTSFRNALLQWKWPHNGAKEAEAFDLAHLNDLTQPYQGHTLTPNMKTLALLLLQKETEWEREKKRCEMNTEKGHRLLLGITGHFNQLLYEGKDASDPVHSPRLAARWLYAGA